MIAYIKGIVTFVHDDAVIVDVQGIGYEIVCANPFAFQSALNEEVFIFTYHHVREDQQVLYGFKKQDEKSLFMRLLQVSGMGPKGALAILASVNINDFVGAIEREDDHFLTRFPGVGKKTARQMILDLKGKLTMMLSVDHQDYQDQTANVEANKQDDVTKELRDAREALKALGYHNREITAIMPKLQQANVTETDELIRLALGLLVKN